MQLGKLPQAIEACGVFDQLLHDAPAHLHQTNVMLDLKVNYRPVTVRSLTRPVQAQIPSSEVPSGRAAERSLHQKRDRVSEMLNNITLCCGCVPLPYLVAAKLNLLASATIGDHIVSLRNTCIFICTLPFEPFDDSPTRCNDPLCGPPSATANIPDHILRRCGKPTNPLPISPEL